MLPRRQIDCAGNGCHPSEGQPIRIVAVELARENPAMFPIEFSHGGLLPERVGDEAGENGS